MAFEPFGLDEDEELSDIWPAKQEAHGCEIPGIFKFKDSAIKRFFHSNASACCIKVTISSYVVYLQNLVANLQKVVLYNT